jgi:type II secretory pathway pseudopilin PulG
MTRCYDSECGDSIIEILIAVAILGIASVGLIPTLMNSLALGDQYRNHSRADQVATQVIESVQATSTPPSGCAVFDWTSLAGSTGYVITTNAVTYWTPTASGDPFTVTACPSTTMPPPFTPGTPRPALYFTQKVKITVAAPGGKGRQTIEVVKRP